MTSGIVLPVLDVGIKYTVLIFCSYYVFHQIRAVPHRGAGDGYCIKAFSFLHFSPYI